MSDDKKTPLERYSDMVDRGEIQPDDAQSAVAHQLEELHRRVSDPGFLALPQRTSGWMMRWFRRAMPPQQQGIYLWGEVGRGKSMLMDLFFLSLPFAEARRVHFHRFMQEVHNRIHVLRQEEKSPRDPLIIVARELVQKYRVLCFDEFQVHDIADAMILSRLFTALFARGMVIVFTSNRPPQDLYLNGLQRNRFLPFIELLKERVKVIELPAQQDYRRSRMSSLQEVYHAPLDASADRFLRSTFAALQSGGKVGPQKVEVQGRYVQVAQACRDIAMFTFDELCAQPLGAPDYLALVTLFRVFLISDIPQMGPENRNEAKRFTTLIDVLYEHRCLLICTAAAPPDALYASGDGHFEFERTASRLIEMQSADYLGSSHGSLRAVS
jgi:cell division protein ZapE